MKKNLLKMSILTLLMTFMFSAIYAQSNLATNHRTPLTDAQQYKMSIDDYTRPVTHKKWVANNKDYRFDYINETFLTSIPTTWTVINDPTSGNGWAWEDGPHPSFPYGKGNACANSDATGGIGVTFLMSPIVDCSAATALFLEFEYQFQKFDIDPDFGTVEVFDGASWVILETFNSDISPTTASYDVFAYKNANFQVRFQYNDETNWDWMFNVSDVRVFSPTATHDMGVSAITPSIVVSGATVTPTVTLENYGSSAEATWTVVLSDGGSYTSTKSNLSTINPAANLVVDMDSWTPAHGNYTLTATVSNVTGDAYAGNDVLTQACSVSPTTWIAASGIIPAPTYMGSSAEYYDGTNHYLYSFGGNTVGSANNETSIYTIETETWTVGTSMPGSSVVGCATTAGDYIYVLRGSDGVYDQNTLYRYDIVDNTWSTLAPIPAATPIAWTQIATVGGNLYCVGGNAGSNAVSSVYRYNVATDAWTSATDIPIPLFCGGLTVVNGKLVYVMGIDASDNIVGTVYVGTIDGTNPDLITWTVGASTCPTPVWKHKACPWLANKLIVTGGNDGVTGGVWGAIAKSYTYDIVTDTWEAIFDKTTPVIGYAAASFVIGNSIRYYVASGLEAGISESSIVEYYTSPSGSAGINNVVVESAVNLYPNPTQGVFTLELGSNNSTVTVYNLMGEVISSKENVSGTVSFDLSNVASGIYLVKIVSDNKVIDKKVNVIH